MDPIQQVQAEIDRIPLEQVNAAIQHRRAVDRTFIVRCVVYLYVASIAVAGLYLVIRGICSPEDRFKDISELIKIGVIPILTLVVGYYFGTEQR